ISTSSALMMNNLRQQGLGSIRMALSAETNIIIRKENPIYSDLLSKEIFPYTFDEIYSSEKIITPSPHCSHNKEAIKKLHTKTKQTEMTRDFITYCLDQ